MPDDEGIEGETAVKGRWETYSGTGPRNGHLGTLDGVAGGHGISATTSLRQFIPAMQVDVGVEASQGGDERTNSAAEEVVRRSTCSIGVRPIWADVSSEGVEGEGEGVEGEDESGEGECEEGQG